MSKLIYEKLPVQVQVMKNTPENHSEIIEWIMSYAHNASSDGTDINIGTLEGNFTASIGDYIIKGVKNEFYPCKPDIFDMTYRMVEE